MACAVLVVFFLVVLQGFYHDDAYIILRYAQNLLQGKGLVWNPGTRVEGYSCFLWLMLISFLGSLNVDLVLASRLLGILFAAATLMILLTMHPSRSRLAALLLSSNSCFALWALGGLETVSFGFFVFLACSIFSFRPPGRRRQFMTGVFFGLAVMTRFEGLLFFGLTLLFSLAGGRRLCAENLKRTLTLCGGFLVLFLPYFVWRFNYFGHLFPCTYYAKTSFSAFKLFFGTRYVFHFLLQYGFPLAVILLIPGRIRFLSKHLYWVCLLIIYTFLLLLFGGDHMPGFRYFVPVLPFIYLLAQSALEESGLIKKKAAVFGAVVFLTGLNFLISYRSIPMSPQASRNTQEHTTKYRLCFRMPDHAAYLGKTVGLYIRNSWPPESLMAGNIAGSIPYFSGVKFIDMLGLNDYTIATRDIPYSAGFLVDYVKKNPLKLFDPSGRQEILKQITNRYLIFQLIPGHCKADGDYVLSRRPDYIILGFAPGSSKARFLSDRELLASPTFQKNYELVQVDLPVRGIFDSFFKDTQDGVLEFTYYRRRPAVQNGAAGKQKD